MCVRACVCVCVCVGPFYIRFCERKKGRFTAAELVGFEDGEGVRMDRAG